MQRPGNEAITLVLHLKQQLVPGADASYSDMRSPPPVGCPSERAMVLAQVQQQQGQGFREVVRKQGLSGLYHGWRATLYRDVYFNMTFFTFREIFVSHWRRRSEGQEPSPGMRVVLGIPAGCIASVVACPFDVVKTRMQGKELLGEPGLGLELGRELSGEPGLGLG